MSHPSLFAAFESVGVIRYKHRVPEQRLCAYGLNIKVSVEKNGLLALVVPDLAEDGRRELEGLAVHLVGAEVHGARLNAEIIELLLEELCHAEDVLPVDGVAAHTEWTS